jgi:hypothetical protein
MPPAGTGDVRVDILVGVYAQAAEDLAALLEAMLIARQERRFVLYRQILRILEELRSQSTRWGKQYVERFFQEADTLAIGQIRQAPTREELQLAWGQANEGAVDALVKGMMNDLDNAFGSIKSLAQKVLRGPAVDPETAQEVSRQVAVGIARGGGQSLQPAVRSVVQKLSDGGFVSIAGRNGRSYTYTLDYYAGLVAHQTQRQAMTLATLMRAQENDFDLVRVSPNPSTIGDYCDAYRGHVFSISGQDPRFPYLGDTPNGGPPFHPWCKHSISIFVPEYHSESEIEEWSQIEDRFLLRPGEEDHSRILRLWTSARQDNPQLGALSHI